MADNITYTTSSPAGVPGSTIQRTDDLGAAGHVPYVKLLDGTDGGTAVIPGDAANGLDVDVTRLPALPAGTNAIGKLAVNDGIDVGDVTINNAAGAAAVNIQDGGNSITIDGSVGITGSAAVTNAGTFAVQDSDKLVDNAAFTDGGTKVLPGGYTFDEVAGTALTENDIAAARVDSKRAQVFVIEDETTRGRRATVTAAKEVLVSVNNASLAVTQGTAANLNAQTVGNIAHGSADSGNPVKIGGVARTANPTVVSTGNRVDSFHDKVGRQAVILNQVRDLVTDNNITLTDTTETTLIAAGAAGIFHDITMLILSNTSVTGVRVDIRDATAGTIKMSVFLAANGGSAVMSFPTPKSQTTAANNWTAQLSATVSDVRIYAQAVKNV